MIDWTKTTLSEISEIIAGYAFKGEDFSDNGDELVIKIKDIQEPFVDTKEATKVFFKNYSYEKLRKFKVTKGDFVLAMTGATIGKIGRYIDANHAYINQRVAKFEAKNDSEKNYIYYVTQHQDFRNHILNNIDSQSAQGNISATSIGRYCLCVPPLSKQKAIAEVLGALDDKIELNRKMNATLEAMARALFKSWFVDFDPVRAKSEGREPFGMDAETAALFPSRLVPSALGDIPDGWAPSKFAAIASFFNSKRIPLSSRERAEKKGKYRYFGATSVMDFVGEYIFDGTYVLTGEDGSVVKEDGTPYLQYVWGKFCVNNHAHILQGRNGWATEGLYLLLCQSNIRHLVTGAVQPKLSMGNLSNLDIVQPTNEVLRLFNDRIESLFAKRKAVEQENTKLEQLRDYLLPKLISGEIRIPDAKKMVETI